MTAEWLLAWWNLLFVVPFGLGLLYLTLYVTTGITFGETDADGGAEADHTLEADGGPEGPPALEGGVEADGSLEADADADADAGAEAHPGVGEGDGGDTAADHDAEAGETSLDPVSATHGGVPAALAHQGLLLQLLGALGLGRVPFSIVLMVLLFSWGAVGFCANVLLRPLTTSGVSLLLSLPAAGIGSIAFTRMVGRLVARWLPTTETYAQRRVDLVGMRGESLFEIDRKFGLAAVRDRRGNLHQVACRTYEDSAPIGKGKRILLVDYDGGERSFYVKETDL